MLTPEDAGLLVQFLDRCSTTGHKERNTLSRLVNVLIEIATKPKKEITTKSKKNDKKEKN